MGTVKRAKLPTTKTADGRTMIGGPGPRTKVPDDAYGSQRFVTVACKLPNGLILEIRPMIDSSEQTPTGIPRSFKIAAASMAPTWPRFHIRGNGIFVGQPPAFPIEHGYAFTPKIPKEFWERWLEVNKDSEVVKNRVIFAFQSIEDVHIEASNNKKVRTGLEPLEPNVEDDNGKVIVLDERLKEFAGRKGKGGIAKFERD
jgi:hypothetical protein